MWRLSTDSNKQLDKLMSTFTEEKCWGTKDWLQHVCGRASISFPLGGMKFELEQRHSKERWKVVFHQCFPLRHHWILTDVSPLGVYVGWGRCLLCIIVLHYWRKLEENAWRGQCMLFGSDTRLVTSVFYLLCAINVSCKERNGLYLNRLACFITSIWEK